MEKLNAVVGQSGGPTCAINSSLAGVIDGCLKSDKIGTIFGSVNGILGVINDNLVDLKPQFSSDDDIKLLQNTPSSFLGSCRYKLPADNGPVFEKIFETFKKHNIGYFFYIGGNDSMDTVCQLNKYAKEKGHDTIIMGVPKTIDNDLAVTDHCPGFGSAAKYIATSVKEVIRDTMVYDIKMVGIIEIMGRNAGWLTAAAALAKGDDCSGADLIYLPEVPFNKEKFFADFEKVAAEKNVIIIAISEGVKFEDGTYLCEGVAANIVDSFGHKYLSGTGKALESIIAEKHSYKVRCVELSALQRCASHFASKTDIDEAFAAGKFAVEKALEGDSGKMVIFNCTRDGGYKMTLESYDISKIANVERFVPREWINKEGNGVTEEAVNYIRPLIYGEAPIKIVDGLPAHKILKI